MKAKLLSVAVALVALATASPALAHARFTHSMKVICCMVLMIEVTDGLQSNAAWAFGAAVRTVVRDSFFYFTANSVRFMKILNT